MGHTLKEIVPKNYSILYLLKVRGIQTLRPICDYERSTKEKKFSNVREVTIGQRLLKYIYLALLADCWCFSKTFSLNWTGTLYFRFFLNPSFYLLLIDESYQGSFVKFKSWIYCIEPWIYHFMYFIAFTCINTLKRQLLWKSSGNLSFVTYLTYFDGNIRSQA